MPDKKLPDNEIVKALEHCRESNYQKDCEICPYDNEVHCLDCLFDDVIDLINRLQAENERLNKELETEKNQVIRLENQIGRLLSMNQAKLDTIHDLQEENNWYNETLNTTKAEAYKEFAEKLNEELRIYGIKDKFNKSIFLNVVDKAKKELVGEDNEN